MRRGRMHTSKRGIQLSADWQFWGYVISNRLREHHAPYSFGEARH